jgi:hypothetical protein
MTTTTTYRILLGNRYDPAGVRLEGPGLAGGCFRADGTAIDDDAWTILAGTFDLRQEDPDYQARLLDAIRATSADGVERSVTVGVETQTSPTAPETALCPRCHSRCYGDCTASR